SRVRRVEALLALAALLCAGCKVDARVDVTLHADGSGTVRARVALDADAVQRLTRHASLDKAVPLGDVRAAGWAVSGWTTSGGAGGAVCVWRLGARGPRRSPPRRGGGVGQQAAVQGKNNARARGRDAGAGTAAGAAEGTHATQCRAVVGGPRERGHVGSLGGR